MPEPSPMGLCYPGSRREIDEGALCDELADSGWLRAYVGWASGQTDAPRIFHVGTGLSIVGASLGNRLRVFAWGRDVYPHLWLCLLAPSGFYRKSTSASMGARLLRDADPTTGDAAGILLPKDFSREKLITYLASRPDGLLVQDEFGEFLSKLTRDYNLGTKELLTGLFDGEVYDRITGREGHVVIRDPAISVLTASTLDWIGDRVTGGDLRGGFLARFLFLPAKEKNDWRGLEDFDDGVLEVRDDLVAGLRQRIGAKARADFRGVKARYNQWLKGFELQTNESNDPRLMGFLSRAGLYVLKLSMCFEACESPLILQGEGAYCRMPIRDTSLTKAIRLWEYLAGHIVEIVTEQIATTYAERNIKKVFEAIDASAEPASESYLLRATRMTKRDLDTYLQTLIAAEQVERYQDERKGPGRRATYYRRRRLIRTQLDQTAPIELPPFPGRNGKNAGQSDGGTGP